MVESITSVCFTCTMMSQYVQPHRERWNLFIEYNDPTLSHQRFKELVITTTQRHWTKRLSTCQIQLLTPDIIIGWATFAADPILSTVFSRQIRDLLFTGNTDVPGDLWPPNYQGPANVNRPWGSFHTAHSATSNASLHAQKPSCVMSSHKCKISPVLPNRPQIAEI